MMNTRIRYILLAVGALLVIWIAWYFRHIVTYILVAAVLSMVGRPLVRWLKLVKIWKFKLGASFSAFITLVAMGVFFFSLFRFLLPLLIKEFEHFANIDVSAYLKQLEKPLSNITRIFYEEPVEFNNSTLMALLGERISSFFEVSQVADLLSSLAGKIGNFLIGVISVAFITFFFLRDENMFRNGLMLLVPSDYEERVERNMDRIAYLLRRYFVGIILEILLVMSLDTLGLLLIGINFSQAVVIGMFCGLFNVIPYLGPWLGSAAGILIGLAININADFMGETLPLIGLMVVVFVTVQIIDNVLIQPFIYSSSVKAHPMEIFLVILAAGSVAGIVGMILAIPVYTIFRVFGAEFLSEIKFVRKLTENMDKDNSKKKYFFLKNHERI